eukprot:Clim_evm44s157 gene=Clim_evmTU44s157
MGMLFLRFLQGPRVYTCAECEAHLTQHNDIISKAFHGATGRAFLFKNVVNVTLGDTEDRVMTTGLHTVVDVCCTRCNTVLGWKYEKAFEDAQKYKEGCFILEQALIHESTVA